MFRVRPYLERTNYVRVNRDTPLTFPGNSQTQNKTGHKLTVIDRDKYYDWYNVYFRVGYTFEAVANGANIAADTQSAPIKGSFSLIERLSLKFAGKCFTTPTASTRRFSSKTCWTSRTIFREAWPNVNFGILTLTPPQ